MHHQPPSIGPSAGFTAGVGHSSFECGELAVQKSEKVIGSNQKELETLRRELMNPQADKSLLAVALQVMCIEHHGFCPFSSVHSEHQASLVLSGERAQVIELFEWAVGLAHTQMSRCPR